MCKSLTIKLTNCPKKVVLAGRNVGRTHPKTSSLGAATGLRTITTFDLQHLRIVARFFHQTRKTRCWAMVRQHNRPKRRGIVGTSGRRLLRNWTWGQLEKQSDPAWSPHQVQICKSHWAQGANNDRSLQHQIAVWTRNAHFLPTCADITSSSFVKID